MGAAFEVYNILGPGFLEAVYQEALSFEMDNREIPHEQQIPIRIFYKSRALLKEYLADFLCYGRIIVEIKSITQLTAKEDAQALNYLKATKHPAGLLINFGNSSKLQWKRFVNTAPGS